MRIAVVVGTRPETVKLAPVANLLGSEAVVVHTGQHFPWLRGWRRFGIERTSRRLA
jgi:UDP-N-acetylglucosamine 2-epimerase